MKTIAKLLSVMFLVAGMTLNASAHEEHHHEKKDTEQKKVEMSDTSKTVINTAVTPMSTGFSTLHPLVVHFPIVLLIIAALLQIAGLFYSKNNWDYITLFLLAGGALGAYFSGSYFHPHTEGLSSSAAEILERHELFASLTLYSSIAALIFKIAGMFLVKSRKRMFEIITAIILLFSAISVSVAGHWGAYLTHVEGVGPQGKFIEIE
ncbi:MAG: hypothetical protein KKG99_13535 [Bacteroidetes bacterium]|nr:hypothetical protein [Bacteroidota bacterium]